MSTKPATAEYAYMNRVSFVHAFVIGVSFRGTQLAGSNFANAVLVNSTFPSAQITPTSETDPAPAVMSDADIRGTKSADVTSGGVTNPANMDGVDLTGSKVSTKSGQLDLSVDRR